MNRERTIYTERSPWPGFAAAVFWSAVVLVCFAMLAGWDHDLPAGARWSIAGGVVALALGTQKLVGGLTVRVQESRIAIHLGSAPLIRRFVAFEEIAAVEAVTYRPILEFGGWGVRGTARRRAWTARGNRAVKLTLTDGRELLVGSDHPMRLEERIRTAAGIVRV